MRLQPQSGIQGGSVPDVAPLWATADASLPLDQPQPAHHLALHKAFTAQTLATGWTKGPRRWATGSFGQYGFDNVQSYKAGQWPRGQQQLGERLGFFNRVQPLLHTGIRMAYAVTEA
jgi:hypothetical protein